MEEKPLYVVISDDGFVWHWTLAMLKRDTIAAAQRTFADRLTWPEIKRRSRCRIGRARIEVVA